MNKKQYIAPQMELETMDTIELIAASGESMVVYPGIGGKKPGDSLANPYRGFEGFGGF